MRSLPRMMRVLILTAAILMNGCGDHSETPQDERTLVDDLISLWNGVVGRPGNKEIRAIEIREKRIGELDARINKGLVMKGQLEQFRRDVFNLKEKMRLASEVLGGRPDLNLWIKSIETLATQSDLSIKNVNPLPERRTGFYAEIPLSVQLMGGCHELGYFCEKIGKETRIISISGLQISALNHNRRSINVSLILSAYYWTGDHSPGSPMASRFPQPLILWASSRVEALDATIVRKEKTVEELQIIVDQVLKYEKERDLLQNRINTIEKFRTNQKRTVGLLDELNRRTPETIWLTSLDANKDLVTVQGRSLSQTSIGDFMGALESSPLFESIRLKNSTISQSDGRDIFQFEIDFSQFASGSEYNSHGIRDLFIPLVATPHKHHKDASGIQGMHLSDLSLQGIQIGLDEVAIFRGSDGKAYTLRTGDTVLDAEVIDIKNNKVVFEKTRMDAFGRVTGKELIELYLNR